MKHASCDAVMQLEIRERRSVLGNTAVRIVRVLCCDVSYVLASGVVEQQYVLLYPGTWYSNYYVHTYSATYSNCNSSSRYSSKLYES